MLKEAIEELYRLHTGFSASMDITVLQYYNITGDRTIGRDGDDRQDYCTLEL